MTYGVGRSARSTEMAELLAAEEQTNITNFKLQGRVPTRPSLGGPIAGTLYRTVLLKVDP